MNLANTTKNQHFISQVEQRLNSITPSAKNKNQKIYSFSLIDRHSDPIKISEPKEVNISNTLSLNDIFSFDILGQDRYNLELLFNRYESDIKKHSDSLISNLNTTKKYMASDVFNIFISKFLNFIRNPYSIKKFLNTMPKFKNLRPTNPVHLESYMRVLHGRKPHQQHFCNKLKITEKEYADWLSAIFILLTPLENGKPNILEQSIKTLFMDKNLIKNIFIFTFDEKTCLLSDRGFSIPLPENEHTSFDFNVNSKCFIRYVFSDILLFSPDTPKAHINSLIENNKTVNIEHMKNDLISLAQYNKNVVYQCYNSVFNSSSKCYGLEL